MTLYLDCEVEIPKELDLEGDYNLITDKALSLLNLENYLKDGEIDVLITDNPGIRELNKSHRGVDSETDVLSFPGFEFISPGEFSAPINEDILGDIAISLDKAISQGEEYGHSLRREMGFLFCHGLLHILGFDHETDSDRIIMENWQKEILDSAEIKR